MSKTETNVFLDALKELYKCIAKLDNALDKNLGYDFLGVSLGPVKNRISNFVRVKVEEFFYANTVNNFIANLPNSENLKKYRYTKGDIEQIYRKWEKLIAKAEIIPKTRTADKKSRLQRIEYKIFISDIEKISEGLKAYIACFEKFIRLEDCEQYMDNLKIV